MFRLCRVFFVSEFTDNHQAMIEQQVDHRFIDIKLLAYVFVSAWLDSFAFFQKGFWRFLHVYAFLALFFFSRFLFLTVVLIHLLRHLLRHNIASLLEAIRLRLDAIATMITRLQAIVTNTK